MNSSEKALEIIDKHYWLFGDGYLGKQHILHAAVEVKGILQHNSFPCNKESDIMINYTYWRDTLREIESNL